MPRHRPAQGPGPQRHGTRQGQLRGLERVRRRWRGRRKRPARRPGLWRRPVRKPRSSGRCRGRWRPRRAHGAASARDPPDPASRSNRRNSSANSRFNIASVRRAGSGFARAVANRESPVAVARGHDWPRCPAARPGCGLPSRSRGSSDCGLSHDQQQARDDREPQQRASGPPRRSRHQRTTARRQRATIANAAMSPQCSREASRPGSCARPPAVAVRAEALVRHKAKQQHLQRRAKPPRPRPMRPERPVFAAGDQLLFVAHDVMAVPAPALSSPAAMGRVSLSRGSTFTARRQPARSALLHR